MGNLQMTREESIRQNKIHCLLEGILGCIAGAHQHKGLYRNIVELNWENA
jgi:hypothetical protein